ncbi:MAG: hypothetical protein ICV70_04915 [Jiangellaceae bacterium]|nr:hypothetical protein [Jiangellaceae bacterium]
MEAPGPQPLLGIYLNDHLAGATGGVQLARRLARAERNSPLGPTLARLADEVAEDRQGLLELMAEFGIPARQYKVAAGWVAERVGRLKLNGRLVSRSPLSTLLELELLRLGVEGKAAGWKTLKVVAAARGSASVERLDGLIGRALEQSQTLEDLRVRTAADVFVLSTARVKGNS